VPPRAFVVRDALGAIADFQRLYARPRGSMRRMTIVLVSASSSRMMRQSPTRKRCSGLPTSLRRGGLVGCSSSCSSTWMIRFLIGGSRRSRSLVARRSTSSDQSASAPPRFELGEADALVPGGAILVRLCERAQVRLGERLVVIRGCRKRCGDRIAALHEVTQGVVCLSVRELVNEPVELFLRRHATDSTRAGSSTTAVPPRGPVGGKARLSGLTSMSHSFRATAAGRLKRLSLRA
jgi:hypothetical protein